MKRYFFSGLLLPFAFLSGCTMPAAHPGSTASASSASQSSVSESGAGYRTVWVAPPVGSLLGGGFIRVADSVQGSDEAALLAASGQLNSVRGTRSERELQSQQNHLQLRFGELCAINTIAHGDRNAIHEIATVESRGRTWTELATANSVSLPAVVETERNADQTTVNSYSNSPTRTKSDQSKQKNLRLQMPPGS